MSITSADPATQYRSYSCQRQQHYHKDTAGGSGYLRGRRSGGGGDRGGSGGGAGFCDMCRQRKRQLRQDQIFGSSYFKSLLEISDLDPLTEEIAKYVDPFVLAELKLQGCFVTRSVSRVCVPA